MNWAARQATQPEEQGTRRRLKRDAIGPLGLAALAIGVTSPAMGLFSLWGTMQSMAGPIAPLIFLSAMLLTLPTAISYAVMNRRMASAGAASTWVWKALSPTAGYQAGLLMTTYFVMGAIQCPLQFGMFFDSLAQMQHWPLTQMQASSIGVVIGTIPIAVACLRGAEASIKTTVRLMIMESVVITALSATIFFARYRATGAISVAPLNPFSATHGVTGYWSAMILGVLAFTGFDIVSTAAEETSAPREHVPKAILYTVIGIAFFWAINSWAFTLSMPVERADAITAQGIPAVVPMAQAYWGFGGLLVTLTAFTGISAIYISSVQGSSRIIFALARHGLLPDALAELQGPRRIPRKAILLVLAVVLSASFASLTILGNSLESFNWWTNAVVFFATLTFISVNVSNCVFALRFQRHSFNVWTNLAIPLLGCAFNGYLLYAAFFSALWTADFRQGRSVVLASLALLAVQVVAVLYVRWRSPSTFEHGPPMAAEADGG